DLQLLRVRLAVLFGEFRLRVEQVHLARAAVLEQADDCLRLRGMVRRPRSERVASRFASLGGEGGEGQSAERAGGPAQEGRAGQREVGQWHHVSPHSTYRKALLARSIWHRSAHARSAALFSLAKTSRWASRNFSHARRSSASGSRPLVRRKASDSRAVGSSPASLARRRARTRARARTNSEFKRASDWRGTVDGVRLPHVVTMVGASNN